MNGPIDPVWITVFVCFIATGCAAVFELCLSKRKINCRVLIGTWGYASMAGAAMSMGLIVWLKEPNLVLIMCLCIFSGLCGIPLLSVIVEIAGKWIIWFARRLRIQITIKEDKGNDYQPP